jgi:hypothetical protein
MIQWYHPLNEIFSFDELPLKDLTKPERSSRPGDKLWWLTNENTKWDDTQNAWLKAPIHLLSAFPGILTHVLFYDKHVWKQEIKQRPRRSEFTSSNVRDLA